MISPTQKMSYEISHCICMVGSRRKENVWWHQLSERWTTTCRESLNSVQKANTEVGTKFDVSDFLPYSCIVCASVKWERSLPTMYKKAEVLVLYFWYYQFNFFFIISIIIALELRLYQPCTCYFVIQIRMWCVSERILIELEI